MPAGSWSPVLCSAPGTLICWEGNLDLADLPCWAGDWVHTGRRRWWNPKRCLVSFSGMSPSDYKIQIKQLGGVQSSWWNLEQAGRCFLRWISSWGREVGKHHRQLYRNKTVGFTRAKIIHPSLTPRSFFVVTLCSLKDETNEAEKYIFCLPVSMETGKQMILPSSRPLPPWGFGVKRSICQMVPGSDVVREGLWSLHFHSWTTVTKQAADTGQTQTCPISCPFIHSETSQSSFQPPAQNSQSLCKA